MTEVIGVKFKKVSKVYYFAPKGIKVAEDDYVIVETARGLEMGQASLANTMVEDDKIVPPLKELVRVATPQDHETLEQNRQKEKQAMGICQQKVEQHGLDMKIVDVEYTFDCNKVLFYFTSDGRIDFRDLVKDLAGVFKTRIELRQIGVRDQSKMLGGLGICGKPFCCATFIDEFQPVSIKMAKEQGLSLNPTKISGTCGRLMCCLKYEQEAYEHLLKSTPPAGSVVETKDGRGLVCDVNLLRGKLKVRLDGQEDVNLKEYHRDDVKLIKKSRKNED